MDSPEHEREAIEAYLAKEASDEQVIHLEKVASERVLGRDRDVWDVHTDVDRWWVITEPTNLYSQTQFPSMDVALSFHVGVTARVEGRRRSAKSAPAPFAEAWRKWEQAGEALNTAHEAEDYQAVGMRCRESMIAFIRAASEIVKVPAGTAAPKGSDVKNWAEVLGDIVVPGDRNKEWRCYLKAVASRTWDLVSALTHEAGAREFRAHIAHQATHHALMNWDLAVTVYCNWDELPRCALCRSYQLHPEYEPGEGFGVIEILVCEKCGWRADGVLVDVETGPEPSATAPAEGDCITVDVPLYPPQKRR